MIFCKLIKNVMNMYSYSVDKFPLESQYWLLLLIGRVGIMMLGIAGTSYYILLQCETIGQKAKLMNSTCE